jgi:hypothetical protein
MKRHVLHCKHYDGRAAILGGCCGAGVPMDSFGPMEGAAYRRPCIQGPSWDAKRAALGITAQPCDKQQMPTPEEAEQESRDLNEYAAKVMKVLAETRTWRVKGKLSADRAEVIECPACKGRLHMRQSAYNGHVAAKCETKGCVSWME